MKLILTTFLIGLGTLLGVNLTTPTPTPSPAPVVQQTVLGDFNPTGGQTYRLQSSISSTQNTITLTSFKEPVSNIPYTMSYLNSTIEYGTIDPQNNSSKEFISFTGITQNANGTALLTGVTRGLGFSYPYTASSTLRSAHSGQSIFIISNPPQLYNQYYNLSNVSTSTNILWFSSTTPPRLDQPGAQSTGTYNATTSEFATIAYVNATGAGVNVNATESVKGISELATAIEQASSTVLGSTAAGLVTQARYATSSPLSSCNSTSIIGALCSIIARNDGKIHPNFIATSSSDVYNFGSIVRFNNMINASSSSNFIASSTMFNLNVGTINATSSIFSNGRNIEARYSAFNTAGISVTTSTGTTTSLITIPAGVMNASSTIDITFKADQSASGGGSSACVWSVRNEAGTPFVSGSGTIGTSIAGQGMMRVQILPTSNSVSAQTTMFNGLVVGATGISAPAGNGTSAFNLANSFSIYINVKGDANSAQCAATNIVVLVNP